MHFKNVYTRPKAKEVLHHPFFWNSMVRLWFLREVSDRVELKDKEGESDILKALENTAPVALGGNWGEKMEASFITNFGRQRRYKYDSIRDLLRLIRNKLNHYGELPKEIQVSVLMSIFYVKRVLSINLLGEPFRLLILIKT